VTPRNKRKNIKNWPFGVNLGWFWKFKKAPPSFWGSADMFVFEESPKQKGKKKENAKQW